MGVKEKMSFDEKMKLVEQGKINKATGKYTSMDAMRQVEHGYKPGESNADFKARKTALSTATKALKASRYGKIAAGVAGAGLALKSYLSSKMDKQDKPKSKMGGGMMKKYSKGDAVKDDTFKPIFEKSEGAKKELAFEQVDSALSEKNIGKGGKMSTRGLMAVVDAASDDNQLESSLRKKLRNAPKSKMGGGMMKKYSSGGDTKLSPKQMKIARMAPPTNKITGADFKAMKASNGKMVMSRGCKIGRNKPTKLS